MSVNCFLKQAIEKDYHFHGIMRLFSGGILVNVKFFFASFEKISCGLYPAFYLYYKFYQNVVRKEITLAHINSQDIVLNIGCGAIPCTAIHTVQMTGAKVIAVDKDEEAVYKAKHCLKKYRLENNIEIVNGDGRKDISSNFSAAIVALHVNEKPLVLKNLKAKGKPGGRLIFRQPSDKYKHVYGCLSEDHPPDYTALQNMETFKSSYLYLIR